MTLLTNDVVQAAQSSVLCWLATVDAAGQPNVSPKEIFAVFDGAHIVVAHIASPKSVRNIGQGAKVCLSFVDVFVQKGFKVLGTAQNVAKTAPGFAAWAAPLLAMAGPRFPIHSVIVVKATAVEPIWAPSYHLYPAQTTEQSQVAAAHVRYGVAAAGAAPSAPSHPSSSARPDAGPAEGSA